MDVKTLWDELDKLVPLGSDSTKNKRTIEQYNKIFDEYKKSNHLSDEETLDNLNDYAVSLKEKELKLKSKEYKEMSIRINR